MDNLALFDIDGTLIMGSRGHHLAFSKAFKQVYGIDTDVDIISHHGMTDQEMIFNILKKNGLNEEKIREKLQECKKMLIDNFNKTINSDSIVILDGVQELLKGLDKNRILIGLVTGNLEPIAKAKLKRAGLNSYFKVGAFGSDDMNRINLVRLAIKRAMELGFNNKRNNKKVFLFGDTPKDILAGKEEGVKTIGIATGIYSKKQLQNAGADFVFANLKDTARILEIIL